ncbi:MAG: hypothetical protein KC900_13475 [Candidatus Omnitrophica bacterium]|nr:hypothetical protein [Candidatus Omnitrophota bacterium]
MTQVKQAKYCVDRFTLTKTGVEEMSMTKYDLYVKALQIKASYSCKDGECGFDPIKYKKLSLDDLSVSFSTTFPVTQDGALHLHQRIKLNTKELWPR